MKLSIFCAVSFVIASTAIVECSTIPGIVPLLVLPNKIVDTSKIQLSGHIPFMLPNFLGSTNTDETSPVILDTAPSQIFDAPAIESSLNEIPVPTAVPVVEPVLEATEEFISYPHQPEPVLTPKEIEDLKSVRKIANQIGECKPESLAKCDIFKLAGGIVCSNTSAGVICDNLDLTPCAELVIDACYDFTDTSGVFCSEGGCAQYQIE